MNTESSKGKHAFLDEKFVPSELKFKKIKTKVESHYDKQTSEILVDRKKSHFYKLRLFNNWTKSALIKRFIKQYANSFSTKGKMRVLDLCGGKFGDLQKWHKLSQKGFIEYVALLDISEKEVSEAINRYNSIIESLLKNKKSLSEAFAVDFYVGNCFAKNISEVLANNIPFDFASCQFALHYAFETKLTAKRIIKNVSACLKQGGFFVGTIPDANVIVKNIRKSGKVDIKSVSLGNAHFNISFPLPNQSGLKKASELSFLEDQPFGLRYRFSLKDAVDNCDEFLVHPETFMRLCGQVGLKCVLFQNFHEFYNEAMTLDLSGNEGLRESFARSVLGIKGSGEKKEIIFFPQKDWEVCGYYAVFAFMKTTKSEIALSDRLSKKNRVILKTVSDIKFF